MLLNQWVRVVGFGWIAVLMVGMTVSNVRAESTDECLQKKQAFWRQSIRDCSRPNAGLFTSEGRISESDVAKRLAARVGSGARAVYLAGSTYALEIEAQDAHLIFFDCRGAKPAFKHEVAFTAMTGPDQAYIGEATVYRDKDGGLLCVLIGSGQAARPAFKQ